MEDASKHNDQEDFTVEHKIGDNVFEHVTAHDWETDHLPVVFNDSNALS